MQGLLTSLEGWIDSECDRKTGTRTVVGRNPQGFVFQYLPDFVSHLVFLTGVSIVTERIHVRNDVERYLMVHISRLDGKDRRLRIYSPKNSL